MSLNIFSQNLSFDKGEVYTLDEISVTGLKSFNEQTVITYTGLSKGKQIRIPGEEISQVINKLWKLELFSDINFYLTNVVDGKASIEIAIVESARIRLRPILMTSLSTIFGVLPLVFSSGPGEASRLTVGITILGGMIFSTFFTLFVIPTVYLVLGKNTDRIDAIEIELNKQLKK